MPLCTRVPGVCGNRFSLGWLSTHRGDGCGHPGLGLSSVCSPPSFPGKEQTRQRVGGKRRQETRAAAHHRPRAHGPAQHTVSPPPVGADDPADHSRAACSPAVPTPGLSRATTRPGAPLPPVSGSGQGVWKKSPNEGGLVLKEPKHIHSTL